MKNLYRKPFQLFQMETGCAHAKNVALMCGNTTATVIVEIGMKRYSIVRTAGIEFASNLRIEAMTLEQILQAASLPVSVAELAQATSLQEPLVYQELVRLEALGNARPIPRYFHKEHRTRGRSAAGWIWIN